MGLPSDREQAERDLYPEVHLCISCLAENLPTFNFCHDCGAPIDFCATSVPFQEDWAVGWVQRAAVAQPNWMSIIAMGSVFGAYLLGGCVVIFGFVHNTRILLAELGWIGLPVGLFWGGVGLAGMLRMAINYRPDAPTEEL